MTGILLLSGNGTPLITQESYGKFGMDLVDSMLNTLQALELANISQLFTSA